VSLISASKEECIAIAQTATVMILSANIVGLVVFCSRTFRIIGTQYN